MRTIEEQIGRRLANERGMGGVVCIWRKDASAEDEKERHGCTVGEFLSQSQNQSGTWLIDGGWGGPPGPICVRWDASAGEWENCGFFLGG